MVYEDDDHFLRLIKLSNFSPFSKLTLWPIKTRNRVARFSQQAPSSVDIDNIY